jgi:hypothetical protein
MKKLILLCLLFCVTPLFSQSVTVTKANSVFTFANYGKKPIVLIVGDLQFSNGPVMPFAHENLFKQNLVLPGDSESFEDPGNQASLTITFVQFGDGTTWGDPGGKSAQFALARRQAALAYLPTLANAGTEEGFVTALNQPQTNTNTVKEQRRYQADVASGGASVTWANVKARWAAAQSRSSLWKF